MQSFGCSYLLCMVQVTVIIIFNEQHILLIAHHVQLGICIYSD